MARESTERAESGPGYRPLVPAITAIAVNTTAAGFLAPLLTLLIDEFRIGLAEAGQLVVATSIAWAAASPFIGLISDRIGRRPVIAGTLGIMGLLTIAGGFAPSYGVLIGLRIAAGLVGSGGPPVILASLGDTYPAERRGFVLGWGNSGYSLAALIGVPLMGVIGGVWGWRAAFWVAGIALIASAGLMLRFYPAVAGGGAGAGNPIRTYGHLLRQRRLIPLLLTNVGERLTFQAFTLYLPIFLIQGHDLTPVTVAPALAAVAVGATSGAVAGGWLADRIARPRLVGASLVLTAIGGAVVYTGAGGLFVTISAAAAFGFVDSAGRPALFALILGLTDRYRGGLLGLVATSNHVGWSIGAGLGGAVVEAAGFPGLIATLAIAPLTAAAIFWWTAAGPGRAGGTGGRGRSEARR